MSSVSEINQLTKNCRDCGCASSCIVSKLSHRQSKNWSANATSQTIGRGEAIFHQGEPIRHLYLVKSGSFKSQYVSAEGEEQVNSFHFPGDMLGIEALEPQIHHNSVIALQTASVCQLPLDFIQSLVAKEPPFAKALMEVAFKQVAERDVHAFIIAQKNARARLAWFLYSISTAYGSRGYQKESFNLSMSRHDIANYLALAVETISRLFTILENDRILTVSRRAIHIHSMDRLEKLAGVTDYPFSSISGANQAALAR